MAVKIIFLGRCCRLIYDMIKLKYKEKTALFDWTWTDTLTEINTILTKIMNNEDVAISFRDNNHFLDGTNIKTSHYVNTDYKTIFDRRAKRFLDDLKTNDKILFIRDDILGTIKYDEICRFNSLIKNYNPDLKYTMLLLSKEINEQIVCENVSHKIYNFSLYPQYINECSSYL